MIVNHNLKSLMNLFLLFDYLSGDLYLTLSTQVEVFSGAVLQLTYANLPGIIFLLLYLQTLKGIIFNSSYSMKVFLVSGFSLLILMVCISFMGEGISSYLSFWKASLFSFPMTLLSLKLYGMLIATVPCMAAQLPLFSLKVFCCYDFLFPLFSAGYLSCHLYFTLLMPWQGLSNPFNLNFLFFKIVVKKLVLLFTSLAMRQVFIMAGPVLESQMASAWGCLLWVFSSCLGVREEVSLETLCELCGNLHLEDSLCPLEYQRLLAAANEASVSLVVSEDNYVVTTFRPN